MSPAIATDPPPATERPVVVWTPVLEVFVPGNPHPQGSKDARPIYRGRGEAREFTGKVAVVERHGGGKLKAWRRSVAEHVGEAWSADPIDAPVRIVLELVMPRPVSTPKRSTPPATKRPDIDKLSRAVLDGVQTGGAYTDDSRVVELVASKRLAEIGETPGARIRVEVPS